MQGIHLRKYGVETTIDFELYEVDGVDLRVDWVPQAADCEIMKDEGASTQCANTATDEGSTYSIVLTATEMEAARHILKIVDSATGKVFLDKVISIETYGHASAQHAFDLNTATQDVNAIQISGSATAADNLETLYDGVEGFYGAYAGPRGPGVYLNDAAGNTNTVNGVDGTLANPVSTIAAAKTIAESLFNKPRIYLINNSDAILAAAMPDYEFVGIGEMMANTIDLGSRDVDHSHFFNVLITGAQGGTQRFQATGCVLFAITGMEITALACLIADNTSLVLRNDCAFDSCFSAVAGGSTPTLNINSVANVNVYFRHHSGGMQIDNAVATTVISYDCPAGQLVIGATCTDLTIVPRGNLSLTDNGTSTNLDPDAVMNRTNVNAEVADVLNTDAQPEVTAVPAANASLSAKVNWMFAQARNKGLQTSTTKTLRNDADDADIATSAISSDGTTFTRNKWI
jgi:hypothetical protein